MTLISSNWKLTLGATVILDYGSWLSEELRFPQSNGLEVVPTPDSAWPLLIDTKNSAVTIRFSILSTASEDKETRASALNQLMTRAAETIAALRIDVNGYTDRYWTFAQCRAKEFESGVIRHAGRPMLSRTYELTCAGLTRTGP